MADWIKNTSELVNSSDTRYCTLDEVGNKVKLNKQKGLN